jgi:hypothetical protein
MGYINYIVHNNKFIVGKLLLYLKNKLLLINGI